MESSFWHQPEDLAAIAVGENVQRPIGSFIDTANSGVEFRQQAFFPDNPLAVQNKPDERSSDQFGDE
jgi:hypothetical protein